MSLEIIAVIDVNITTICTTFVFIIAFVLIIAVITISIIAVIAVNITTMHVRSALRACNLARS